MKCAFRDVSRNHNFLQLLLEEEDDNEEQVVDNQEQKENEPVAEISPDIDESLDVEIIDSDNEYSDEEESAEIEDNGKIIWSGCKAHHISTVVKRSLHKSSRIVN